MLNFLSTVYVINHIPLLIPPPPCVSMTHFMLKECIYQNNLFCTYVHRVLYFYLLHPQPTFPPHLLLLFLTFPFIYLINTFLLPPNFPQTLIHIISKPHFSPLFIFRIYACRFHCSYLPNYPHYFKLLLSMCRYPLEDIRSTYPFFPLPLLLSFIPHHTTHPFISSHTSHSLPLLYSMIPPFIWVFCMHKMFNLSLPKLTLLPFFSPRRSSYSY